MWCVHSNCGNAWRNWMKNCTRCWWDSNLSCFKFHRIPNITVWHNCLDSYICTRVFHWNCPVKLFGIVLCTKHGIGTVLAPTDCCSAILWNGFLKSAALTFQPLSLFRRPKKITKNSLASFCLLEKGLHQYCKHVPVCEVKTY